MKKGIIILSAIALGLFAFTSCNKEMDVDTVPGAVQFGVSTTYASDPATRTEYSGKDEYGNVISSTSAREVINWLSTDKIRILSPQASDRYSDNKFADYDIVPATCNASTATLVPSSGNGLVWGEGEHNFFAVYPSPELNSTVSITESTTAGKAKVSGTIPAVQEVTLDPATREFKPDMSYAYMYAVATGTEGSAVQLEFKPLVTTFEFTLLTNAGDEIESNLTSLVLSIYGTGTVNQRLTQLSGDFTTEVSSTGFTSMEMRKTMFNTSRNITINLPDGGVRLSSNPAEAYKVTFFCLPCDEISGLQLLLRFGDGTTQSRRIQLGEDDGVSAINYFSFPACSKNYFWNVDPPKTVYKFRDIIASEITVSPLGGSVNLTGNGGTFYSYVSEIGSEDTPVPFKFQYAASEDGPWTDGLPEWLEADESIDFGGSVEYISFLPINCSPNTSGSHVEETASAHTAALQAATPKDNFDLSTINVSTGATVQTSTANCYVVQGPGTYKFPLVYGNALKNGQVNDGAFHKQNTATGSRFLNYYLDHNDDQIKNDGSAGTNYTSNSIYIAERFSGKTITAALLWTDAEGLVTDVAISGTGTDAYMTFNVPQATICQGNALVAVLVDGVIAWSWHIWVTDFDLTQLYDLNTGSMFAKLNLGWCEYGNEVFEPSTQRDCYVRAVQDVTGKTSSTSHIIQRPGAGFDLTHNLGNNLYYQWGRKDPLYANARIATWENRNTTNTFYGDFTPVTVLKSESTTIGYAIQKPYEFYTSIQQDFNTTTCWHTSTARYNLWNSASTGSASSTDFEAYHDVVTKTIYDPCPVGFKVPNWDAFPKLEINQTLIQLGSRNYDDRTGQWYSLPNTDFQIPFMGRRDDASNGDLVASKFLTVYMENKYWSALAFTTTAGVRWMGSRFHSQTWDLMRGLSIRPIQDL